MLGAWWAVVVEDRCEDMLILARGAWLDVRMFIMLRYANEGAGAWQDSYGGLC